MPAAVVIPFIDEDDDGVAKAAAEKAAAEQTGAAGAGAKACEERPAAGTGIAGDEEESKVDGGAEGRRGCRCDRLVTSFQGLSGQILSNMKPSTASHAAFGLISKSASLRGGGTESRSDMRRGSLRYDVGPAWKAIFGAMLSLSAPGRPLGQG